MPITYKVSPTWADDTKKKKWQAGREKVHGFQLYTDNYRKLSKTVSGKNSSVWGRADQLVFQDQTTTLQKTYISNMDQQFIFRNIYVYANAYMHIMTMKKKKKKPWIWSRAGRDLWEDWEGGQRRGTCCNSIPVSKVNNNSRKVEEQKRKLPSHASAEFYACILHSLAMLARTSDHRRNGWKWYGLDLVFMFTCLKLSFLSNNELN